MILFIAFLSLLFKWPRLIFILLSYEFLVICLFYSFSLSRTEVMYFYYMCFTVIARVFGLVVMAGRIKYYGSDMCLF